MKTVQEFLFRLEYKVSQQSDGYVQVSKAVSDVVSCRIDLVVHDGDQPMCSVQGWISIKEVIGPEMYWEAEGMELGPNGLFLANSHMAGEYPADKETRTIEGIQYELMPWLDEYSDIDNLIALIEGYYFDGYKVQSKKPPSGLAKIFLREIGVGERGSAACETIFRPKDAHLLANLYYRIGDNEKAVFFANRWIELRGAPNVDPEYLRLAKTHLDV